jgi:hypothetical protein
MVVGKPISLLRSSCCVTQWFDKLQLGVCKQELGQGAGQKLHSPAHFGQFFGLLGWLGWSWVLAFL